MTDIDTSTEGGQTNWANEDLRMIKRQLSVFEKSSVPNTNGRAIILPSEPNTEVEELIGVGFDPMRIFCIEHEQDKADKLYAHYWDDCHVHWEDVGTWMQRARGEGRYSYVHLDFCGHLKHEEIAAIQQCKRLMAPVSRVRVSVFRGMRLKHQFDLENMVRDQVLLRICEMCGAADEIFPDRWQLFYDQIRENYDDTTQIVIATLLMTFFFGLDSIWDYTDRCNLEGPYLPEVHGNHTLVNIQRFVYHEIAAPNHMFSVWADVAPIANETVKESIQWRLNEIAKVFESISYRPPNFTPNLPRR